MEKSFLSMLLKADVQETLMPVESCKRQDRWWLDVVEDELCGRRKARSGRDCWLKGSVEGRRSLLNRTLPGLNRLYPRKEDADSYFKLAFAARETRLRCCVVDAKVVGGAQQIQRRTEGTEMRHRWPIVEITINFHNFTLLLTAVGGGL
jgi:hypothetical protein